METIRKQFPHQVEKTAPRTFTMTLSTGTVDRDGDVIDPRGWKLDAYRKNPIVLFQHQRDLPPVARATSIGVVGGKLTATLEFPPAGISERADEIHGLMDAGFLHSSSVGFLPLQRSRSAVRDGSDIHEAELLEFSIVNIPSNPQATVQRRRFTPEQCKRVAAEVRLAVEKSIAAISMTKSRQVLGPHETIEPLPTATDIEQTYMDRCMVDGHMRAHFPDTGERLTRCSTLWLAGTTQPGMRSKGDVVLEIADEPFLVVADTFDVSDEEIAALVRKAFLGVYSEAVEAAVAAQIRRHTGKVL